MNVPLLVPTHRWYCDRCSQTDVTHDVVPHFRYHTCPGWRGMSAPFILEGTKAKVTLHEPEDYVGDRMVQRDERGRPVMSITTERENGRMDTIVFAPAAMVRVQEAT
jgi:hypothetical protein